MQVSSWQGPRPAGGGSFCPPHAGENDKMGEDISGSCGKGSIDRIGGVSGASLALMGNDDRSSGRGNGIVVDADADGQWNARNNEDDGRWNQTGSARAGRKRSDIGGIGCLLDEVPEDFPRRNVEAVIPEVIPADVH
jgi:hypothetical protein